MRIINRGVNSCSMTNYMLLVFVNVGIFIGSIFIQVQCENYVADPLNIVRNSHFVNLSNASNLVTVTKRRHDGVSSVHIGADNRHLSARRPQTYEELRHAQTGHSLDLKVQKKMLIRSINYPRATQFAYRKYIDAINIGKTKFSQIVNNSFANILPYRSEQYSQNFNISPQLYKNVHNINDQRKAFDKKSAPLYIQQHAIPIQPSYFGMRHHFTNYRAESSKHTSNQQKLLEHRAIRPVYEETENKKTRFGLNYHIEGKRDQMTAEAQEYLHFMGTNEYFLPKLEPNYKQIDSEHTNVQRQKQIYKKKDRQSQLLQNENVLNRSSSIVYSYPIQDSSEFNQFKPTLLPSTIIRGSYQMGHGAFVVKSDGNKAAKYILTTPLDSHSTTKIPLFYKQHVTHMTEPLRFEFTEKDAIGIKYIDPKQGQKDPWIIESTTNLPPINYNSNTNINITNILNQPIRKMNGSKHSVDTYDKENVQKLTKQTISNNADNENGTEVYCEKICANVYEESDDIICGSDGYMYKGVAQLECYASCLKNNVSIRTKGSCG